MYTISTFQMLCNTIHFSAFTWAVWHWVALAPRMIQLCASCLRAPATPGYVRIPLSGRPAAGPTVLTTGEQSNNCADLACGSTIEKKSHMTPSQTVQTHEDWLVCSVILLDGRQSHHINNSINLSALADETSLVSSNGSQALCGDLSI